MSFAKNPLHLLQERDFRPIRITRLRGDQAVLAMQDSSHEPLAPDLDRLLERVHLVKREVFCPVGLYPAVRYGLPSQMTAQEHKRDPPVLLKVLDTEQALHLSDNPTFLLGLAYRCTFRCLRRIHDPPRNDPLPFQWVAFGLPYKQHPTLSADHGTYT